MIDHSGAVHRHGFVEDPVERRLEPDRLAENPTHAARGKNGSKSRLLDCTRCGALRVGGEACRHCGFKPSPPAKFVATVDADLALVKRNDEVLKPIPSLEEKYRWLRELTAIAAERG